MPTEYGIDLLPQYDIAFLQKNIRYIVKLQAWVRGNKARKELAFKKSKQIGSSKYFTYAEFNETVQGNDENA
jgi:hypothetical protein